jgi:hypothetical protein
VVEDRDGAVNCAWRGREMVACRRVCEVHRASCCFIRPDPATLPRPSELCHIRSTTYSLDPEISHLPTRTLGNGIKGSSGTTVGIIFSIKDFEILTMGQLTATLTTSRQSSRSSAFSYQDIDVAQLSIYTSQSACILNNRYRFCESGLILYDAIIVGPILIWRAGRHLYTAKAIDR